MNKIILFSRTSTTQQDVEQQTKDLIREASNLGYSKANQIIIEYQESGIKLDIDSRQGIRKLKETILSNSDIDCVLCWELTRIARRADVIYNIRDFLLEHKIRWIVLKPSLIEIIDRDGKLTQTSSLILGIFTAFAESEMTIKKERFMRAKNELTKQGKKATGAVIFGYMKDKNKNCIPHPTNSKVIVDLFHYYIYTDGATVYETYKYACSKYPDLFKMMIYSKAHRKMMHILGTEVYGKGNWCYPPLISEDGYNTAREKMSKAKCQARYESKCKILGRGKVYCKHCGHMLTGVGGSVKAYNCSYKDGNHSITISVDIVDQLIWEETRVIANINAAISNNTKINEINKDIEQKRSLIENYKSMLDEVEKKENRLIDLYINDKIKSEIYDAKSIELTSERKKAEYNITTLENNIKALEVILDSTQKDILNYKTLNYDSIDDFETRQELVRKYIDKVYVERIKPRVYMIEFTYTSGIYIVQRGLYRYDAKNQHKKLFRINQDGTEDLI